MGNIKNFFYNTSDLVLSRHKYYDLYLSPDNIRMTPVTSFFSGDTLSAYFDFNNQNIYSTGSTSANTIYSLTTWTDAINSGDTLFDIGLTGVDNGLITYDRLTGDTGNTLLVSAMTTSTLALVTGDTRLYLNSVTGNSDTYIYPINILSDNTGNYAQLCGGFYQGFYKLDGFDYQVLPNRVENGFVVEFWLNKSSSPCTGYTGTTLNDVYPNNKGFFFYLGTRAENKYWNTFYGLNTGCTSGCTSGTCSSGETVTSGCTIQKETNSYTSTGWPLYPSSYNETEICNQFLIYDRTPSGYTTCNFDQGDCFTLTAMTYQNHNLENLFPILSRAKSGTTICDLEDRDIDIRGTNLDVNSDIVDNALGFRIKDDGSIGYRLLTYSATCSGDTTITGTTIEEEYSLSGMVENDVWTHIAIRFIPDIIYEICDLKYKPKRSGKLYFYVNSKLKLIVNNFDEFIARRLNDDITKQESVPFNISIGGGSQGLIDSQTFDGQDPDDKGLLIEQNFAGTFIGGISKFRFYTDRLCYCTIQDNFNIERDIYL